MEDYNEDYIELRDWIRRDTLFTGHGTIKLNLSPEQIENWYNHLLEEVPIKSKKISKINQAEILMLSAEGHTEPEISRIIGTSRTSIRDFLINHTYNILLDRVDECAKALGDREEPVWEHGNHIIKVGQFK